MRMQYPVSAQYAPLSGLAGMLSGYSPKMHKPQERPTTKPCRKCGTVHQFTEYRIIDDNVPSKKRRRSHYCPECEKLGSPFERALTALFEALGEQKLTANQLSALTGSDATTVRTRMNVLISRQMIVRSKKMPYLFSHVEIKT